MNRTLQKIFPYESPRKYQGWLTEQLNGVIADPDYKFAIVEAPTGFGKTAVAGTVSAANAPAYFLTEQKIHQEQMREEFPMNTQVCKGRYNYQCGKECEEWECLDEYPGKSCKYKPSEGNTGEYAGCSARRGDLYWEEGMSRRCPYFQSKTNGMDSPIACLNYSYFFNETYYSGDFGERDVLIADEAHNIEKNLQSFLSFRVDDFIQDQTGLELEDRGEKVSEWEDWILRELRPVIEGRLNELEERVENIWEGTEATERQQILTTRDTVDEILCNINRFDSEYDAEFFDDLDWAVEREYTDEGDLESVEFTPVSVAPFANRFLWEYADTVIMMSATVLDFDTLCRSLGLMQHKGEIATFNFPSPFDTENRPIFYYDAPSVNHDNWNESFKHIAKLVDVVAQLPENLDQKGIIHSVSYNNEEMIKRHVSRPIRRRLVTHGPDDPARETVLEDFKGSNGDDILMSPGIYEGVDLKHDMSRFQIVPKVPYLSLGSKAIQYKREQDPRWYDWRTAIRLIQSFGRSVRADDDYARTYIVDGSFQNLWNRVGGMIPEYIEDATTKKSVQELLERSRSNAY